MAAKKTNEDASVETVAASIVVTGPEAGRYRARHYFCAVPRTLQLSELDAEDLQAIESDPLLKVRRVN